MKKASKFFLFSILFFVCFFAFGLVYADGNNPYTEYFRGRGSILIVTSLTTNENNMPIPKNNAKLFPGVFQEALSEIFSTEKWVSINTWDPSKEIPSNVLFFNFKPSSQKITINDRVVMMGSLTLQLQYYDAHKKVLAIPVPSVPYVFVLPETSTELMEEFKSGVKYLSSNFPKYFSCANMKNTDSCR